MQTGKLGGQNTVPRIITDQALFDDLKAFAGWGGSTQQPVFAQSVLTLSIREFTLLPMSRDRLSSSSSRNDATVAVAERSSASDTKGSINLRMDARTRRLIDDAAAVLGKTRTEFMVETARRQAIDVLLDQRLFTLEPDRFDAFMHALDNPPAPGPRLQALLRRVPAWRK